MQNLISNGLIRTDFISPPFQENLGIARNILTRRLTRLVEEAIFEKTPVTPGGHAEYRLTKKGLALQPRCPYLCGNMHFASPVGSFVMSSKQQG